MQSLNFNYQAGQTAPPSQTVTVTSSGAPLNYQVAVNTTSCTGFLKATPANGSTFGNQNQVIVSVIPGSISPQVCSGNVTLTVPGSTAAPLVIPVTFNVSNNALLSVSVPAIKLRLSPARRCHRSDHFSDQQQYRASVLRHRVDEPGGVELAVGGPE